MTTAEFIALAKAGEREADALVAKALNWTQVRLYHLPPPRWIGRRPGRSGSDTLVDAYATGTDGRLLVEVLDTARATGVTLVIRLPVDDRDDVVGIRVWGAGTLGIVDIEAPNIFIAACAALLVVKGVLTDE